MATRKSAAYRSARNWIGREGATSDGPFTGTWNNDLQCAALVTRDIYLPVALSYERRSSLTKRDDVVLVRSVESRLEPEYNRQLRAVHEALADAGYRLSPDPVHVTWAGVSYLEYVGEKSR